jgi:hypothetical protein
MRLLKQLLKHSSPHLLFLDHVPPGTTVMACGECCLVAMYGMLRLAELKDVGVSCLDYYI